MGTPVLFDQGWAENETPLRWVSVPAFAIGRFEVTRAQWTQFQRERAAALSAAAAASAPAPAPAPVADCQVPVTENQSVVLRLQPGRDWANPGFAQGDDHPVACVARPDAEAYVAWLSQRTGQRYRLPTEAEWEYASRAGSSDRRPWSGGGSCGVANLRDIQYRQTFATNDRVDCNDGAAGTGPVGRHQPNPWGLFDMVGNVAEHVADCWGSYAGAPTDGSAARAGLCGSTVVRGGSWYTHPGALGASHAGRQSALRGNPLSTQGLRVVRELAPATGAPR
jgi:formylglycine-generating enzyme required for sulfatase activity